MVAKRTAPALPNVAGKSAKVEAFLDALDHPHAAGIRHLRERILALDPRIGEEVKWNAPSFRLDDHFATFKLHPPTAIRLVLHAGAKARKPPRPFTLRDPEGLVTWAAPDRCLVTVAGSEAAVAKAGAIADLLGQWMRQLEACGP